MVVTPGPDELLLTGVVAKAAQSAKAYKSFRAFKREMGKAGKDMEWHHIVEQHKADTKQFGAEAIHSTDNIVRVPKEVNREINRYYSSKDRSISGDLTVRKWLETQSYEKQREFGQQVLEREMRKYNGYR